MFPIISMNMIQWELRYTMSKMLKDGIKGFDSPYRSRIYLLDNNKKKKALTVKPFDIQKKNGFIPYIYCSFA